MPARFNHMELTLPQGELDLHRKEIADFYGELFGWEAIDVPILGQIGLLLRTDPETSQFILVTEQKKYMDSPGYDHLGLLYDDREEVDALLAQAKARQALDPRVQIKEYEDLVTGGVTTHAFYVRHLLPIWLDVQCQEYAEGAQPARAWRFG
ncbi:MAG TPA: VOC family protein [Myxococcota bacterium]|nr:VOC family protein [Myxococcota bacterium]